MHDDTTRFMADVIEGLGASPKRLPPKYFYDAAGSALFLDITRLDEYYVTRAELEILGRYATDIASHVPAGAVLVEFGSGASTKIRKLLDALPRLTGYVPVDISVELLAQEADELHRDFPALPVWPIATDFTTEFALPAAATHSPKVGFFPGSTIGNFEPHEAEHFLACAAHTLGPGSAFIVGVDLEKSPATLHAAYNDAAGITARFNLNMLTRIRRELDAHIDPQGFRHHAFYNTDARRIEMHLVATRAQTVHVDGHSFQFADGESIHTENSYKYTPARFAELAARAGWQTEASWTDAQGLMSVHALRCRC
ncbi:L-histidine N(alpha)-methyltransferase [Jeongeupia naejangsanensis]|uniref:L-histidine N(Alpha)-methyltransferase n=1 Tax=Jeongeupia naejangsanensis TaxID=613195 RepID=A0ABS2BGF2_9NEIS|nr:L-histidine N(alpha)-methyltransferase [Jeongeupia naejangsanensis]MBM3114689.1 L-histidine N(alpha)-methyltransferase [Jeongeupia naejangsanensis]